MSEASDARGRRNLARAAAIGAGGLVAAAGVAYAAGRARRAASGPARTAPAGLPAGNELDLPAETTYRDLTLRDGGTCHLAEMGDGPPVVLLHGLTLQASVWAYQFRDLADRHRVIALDLRGHGKSEPGSEGMSIAAIADDLAEVLGQLGLERATVVGHSMGGMAVLRFCRRHPDVVAERVGAIAIVASAGGIRPPLAGWERIAPPLAAMVVAGHAAANSAGRPIVPGNALGQRGARIAFGLKPDPSAVRRTLEYARDMDPARFFALVPELTNFDERAAFEYLSVPSVVVVGSRDHLTPPRYARALARTLPGSRLVVWPGAGHMLMYERREALDWLIARLSEEAQAP